jgi:hypothetical protein
MGESGGGGGGDSVISLRCRRTNPTIWSHETDEDYPANCQYFSIEVPEGTSLLEIEISDMGTDLDLYVQYENTSFDESYDEDAEGFWFSNEGDVVDDGVSISSPQAGTYYIEVYSVGGEGTDYTLTTTVR